MAADNDIESTFNRGRPLLPGLQPNGFARPFLRAAVPLNCQFAEPKVGSWGALIMSFFGAVFAAFTVFWEWHVAGLALIAPFLAFGVIGSIATYVICLSGDGIIPSAKDKRAIMWSSIGEGVGLFIASNIVINLHRPELLLPAMALVVGSHFLPIGFAAAFPPFYVLGAVMIAFAVAGFVVRAPAGGEISGVMAAVGLWTAAAIAIRRDWRAKRPKGVGL